MPGIDAIGGQVCQRTEFLRLKNPPHVASILMSSFCSLRTHLAMTEQTSKWMRLLRISGYVQKVLPGLATPACAFANWQAQLTQRNDELIHQPTGGDKRVDRRVEKRLGHVRRLDIPDATMMANCGTLTGHSNDGSRGSPTARVGCYDKPLLPSNSTKVIRPTQIKLDCFAYKALRLRGFTNNYDSLLVCCRFICRYF